MALYKTRESLNATLKLVWKATNIVEQANAEVNLDLKVPSQPNQTRNWIWNRKPQSISCREKKTRVNKTTFFAEQQEIAHSASLKQQGA